MRTHISVDACAIISVHVCRVSDEEEEEEDKQEDEEEVLVVVVV